MKKSGIALAAMFALMLAIPAVYAPATIHSVPVAPPNCTSCSPAGGFQVIVNSPGTITEQINFTINVQNKNDAYNIQAYFISNDSASFAALTSVSMVETGMGSPDSGTSGNALTQHGPFTGTPWTYPPAGPIFPNSGGWYNFTYVWTHLVGPSNGFNFWKVINVTFTVTGPSAFYILATGNAGSPTDFTGPYRTPYSETTQVVVIPEFLIGTIAAVVLPLIALAGYMRFKRNGIAVTP